MRTNGDRLWNRLMDVARFGALPGGGVNRQALSPADAEAMAWLAGLAVARGFSVRLDPIGNLYLRRGGSDPQAAPVLLGSHLDSQPTGGRFDGAFGVMAAFEVLETLEDAAHNTRRPIEAVAWMNEEGSRFQPGAMGSAVAGGKLALDQALAARDWDGVSVAEALAVVADHVPVPRAPFGPAPHCYLEAHIEQGPVLEAAGLPLAIVTGVQGIRRFAVEVEGEPAHAGTTPRALRRDALQAALRVVAALTEAAKDAEDVLRFTVGRFEVLPGSPNTVPALVRFTIDLRHPEDAALERFAQALDGIVERVAAPCVARCKAVSRTPPTVFDAGLVKLLDRCAARAGHARMQLPSGAGHDAMHIARICPTAMLFVPCRGGVSHNEAEWAEPAHLAIAAEVLALATIELAG